MSRGWYLFAGLLLLPLYLLFIFLEIPIGFIVTLFAAGLIYPYWGGGGVYMIHRLIYVGFIIAMVTSFSDWLRETRKAQTAAV